MGKPKSGGGSNPATKNCKEFNNKTYRPVIFVSRGKKTMAAMDISSNEILRINGKVVNYKSL